MFIPAHIWVSKELIPAEKMLLGEVDALSKRTGWCEASREHFADWLQCTPQNVTYYFNKLEKSGFLKILRIPGKRHKCKVVSSKFHASEGVNGTDGLEGSAGFTPPVNGTDPTRQPGLPEIQLKDNKKYKRKARAKNSPTLKTETPLSENKAGGGAAQNPPSPESVAYTTDPAELEMLLRTYYMARPDDWKVIKERLDRAAAQAGKKYDKEKIADVVSRYCDWTITKGHTGWTFSQHHSRLRMWMADQPGKELQTNQSATTDAKTGVYTPPKRLITA